MPAPKVVPFTTAIVDLLLLVLVLIPVAIAVPIRIAFRLLFHFLEGCFTRPLPPLVLTHPSLTESATSVAAKIKDGVYTSEEVVSAAIAHARAGQPRLNAICDWRVEEALEEARAVDQDLKARRTASNSSTSKAASSPLPPFYGVPCSVKECFDTGTMVCGTNGIPSRRARKAQGKDATLVKRVRESGFIPICNTNTSEICMWYESSNLLYGRSCNPYDLRRIVGGSSGGEACLIASAAVSVGIGSDIGGSIRMPAGFNGVWGHKATGGLLPSSGQIPTTPYPFMVSGPLARYSEDLQPLLDLMKGPDGLDRSCVKTSMRKVNLPFNPLEEGDAGSGSEEAAVDEKDTKGKGKGKEKGKSAASTSSSTSSTHVASPSSTAPSSAAGAAAAEDDVSLLPAITSWRDVTVFVVPWDKLDAARPPLSNPVQPSIRKAVDLAAETLVKKFGAKGPVPFEFPEFYESFDLWAAILGDAEDNPLFATLMQRGHNREGRLWFSWEVLKWCVGMSSITLPAGLLAMLEHLPASLSPSRHRRLVEDAMKLRARIHQTLRDHNGLLLFPIHPTVAPIHDVPLLRCLNIGYTAIFNILEVPCTAVPMGLDEGGVPVGIQVISARGHDNLTIAAARGLERAGVAGWVPPPPFLAAKEL